VSTPRLFISSRVWSRVASSELSRREESSMIEACPGAAEAAAGTPRRAARQRRGMRERLRNMPTTEENNEPTGRFRSNAAYRRRIPRGTED